MAYTSGSNNGRNQGRFQPVSLGGRFQSYLVIKSHYGQWRSHSKNLGEQKILGAKIFDFRRITLLCLEKRLSKHKMTIFSKNVGGAMAPLPPLATPMITGSLL